MKDVRGLELGVARRRRSTGCRPTAAGSRPTRSLVAPADSPEFAMPAAAWAAKSGQPVLWTLKDSLPAETRAAIAAHPQGADLRARAARGDRRERGHGAAASSAGRSASPGPTRSRTRSPSRASPTARSAGTSSTPATASCSPTPRGRSTPRPARRSRAAASTGRCCSLTEAASLPAPVQEYLLDIQPGYEEDPVRGVYNHGWLMGDETAISADVQSRIDALLEIQPVESGGE